MLDIKKIKPEVQFVLKEPNNCPLLLQGTFRYSLNGGYFYVVVKAEIKLYGNLQYEGFAVPTDVGHTIFEEEGMDENHLISSYCVGTFSSILNNDELNKMIADYEKRVKRAKKYQREVAKDVLRGEIFRRNGNTAVRGK